VYTRKYAQVKLFKVVLIDCRKQIERLWRGEVDGIGNASAEGLTHLNIKS
jgi:hypothetical protein